MARASIVVAFAALTSAPAGAVPVLDQEHDFMSASANSTNGNVSEVGQTFTVGVAGTLDSIEVLMFRLGSIFDPTADPVLSVYATDEDGLPTGVALASATTPKALVPLNTAGFVSFDVSGAAVPVNVGDVLALAISTSSSVGPYFLLADSDTGQPSDYGAGEAVSRISSPPGDWSALTPAQDHGFRTWVEAVPEPSATTLLVTGVGTLTVLHSRARVLRRRRSGRSGARS